MKKAHPYIPNSNPRVKEEMLKKIGVSSTDELYSDIPEELRYRKELNIPSACVSEFELRKHVEGLLKKNTSCNEAISFLGAGCYNHYIPAVVEEVMHRSEFLTAYAGEPYEDKGRFQALFEYESLMAELLDFDVVNVPTFDWTQAASSALRMVARMNGRNKILIADNVSPDRYKGVFNYCTPVLEVVTFKHDATTGLIDMNDLKSKVDHNTAAIYFENPSYFGTIEVMGQEIADLAHANGAQLVVGVDPSTLGVLATPSQYGADLACGDIQTLGLGLNFGGALGGFIATKNDVKIVNEYPWRLFGVTTTSTKGEWGFGDVAYYRTSFDKREGGKEFVGTAAGLHGIGAGVYLALMGPVGMKELGTHIAQKSQYLKKKISEIKGVSVKFSSSFLKEFVVDFSATNKSVAQINEALLSKGIFGGKDLGQEFPSLKNCALYCVTEVVSKEEIDKLISSLKEIV